jgi:outer membrane murein-binding lipoprotein Lpp
MRKETMIIAVILGGLFLTGCSQKEVKADAVASSVVSSKIEKKSDTLKKESDIAIEVKPIVDNKLEVVTKVKPEIDVVSTEKVKKGEIPVVVVEPVEVGTPVKEVEILPVVDDTLPVVTKVKPTIEVVEEIPVEEGSSAVVIEPIIE